ncbi:MAG TPA: hypothetical protein VJO34_14760 [Methylomirabilota bacterium]|nr:hypothetical protein [Methylomirabilota bacterium]
MELFERRVLREGIIAGLLGAAIVAVWFLIVDALAGQPFATPAYLWGAIFKGLRDPHTIQVSARAVFGYTVLHLFAFAAFGLLCAMLIAAAEQDSAYVSASLVLFGCFQLFLLGLAWFLSRWVVQLLWWEVLIANLLASSVMAGYFFLGHRALGASVIGEVRVTLRKGTVAGLIGAGLVAIWFLIFDLAQGQPLRTPALLGAALFEGLRDPAQLQITIPIVAGYTVLHVVAFALFGVLCATVLAALEREPVLIWAFIALFACFEVFFFVLQGVVGSALGALVGWSVLAGNLLASAGMLGYFFIGHRALGREILGRHATALRDGVIAGLIGAGAVAFWFLLYDIAKGQPLRTPALLGAALFQGIAAPEAVHVNLAAVAGYTIVHALAFVIFGIIAAFLVVAAERQPLLLIGLFMLFAAFEVFFFGLILILAESILGALVWWAIFIGNLLAAGAMLLYFFAGHRALGRRLLEPWPSEEGT